MASSDDHNGQGVVSPASIAQEKGDPLEVTGSEPSEKEDQISSTGSEPRENEDHSPSPSSPVSDAHGARPKEIPKPKITPIEKDGDNGETEEAEILPITDSCLDNLSKGLLDSLLPLFQKHEESLTELTRNQVLLIETLQQENQKFAENKMVGDLTKMMLEARRYQGKLTAVKKEMTSLHEKSTKLKKRALKLQQQKMKDNLEKEQQREREIEEDRKLAAKRPMHTASTKTDPHR